MIKIRKKYLTTEVELEISGSDIKDELFRASIFTCDDICNLCSSKDIALVGNKTEEGHQYVKRLCTKCGATSNLGSYKEGKAYFWHKFAKWEGKEQGKE
jgi:hypothetical protein